VHAGPAGDGAGVSGLGPALAVRTRIAALQLVACRMAHERVRWDDQGRIVRRGADGPDDGVLRVPLCGADTRAQRLACGHTPARNEMQRAIAELGASGALSDEQCRTFAAELQAIGDEIQSLDHRKGEAEKRHALSIESNRFMAARPAPTLEESAAHLKALEREQEGHVQRLRDWRDRVLRAVDAAIAGSAAGG
jgi:hypothetical protein